MLFRSAASKLLETGKSPQDIAALLAEDLTKAMEGLTDSLADMTFGNLLLRNGGLRLIADSAIDDPFKRYEQQMTTNYGQYYQVYEGQWIKKPGVI